MRRLPVDLLVAGGLFVVQAALIAPLFAGDFTRARGSIESAYITDARFIADHFPDLSWNPLWYLGFPFEWFYTPLLPAVVAALGKLTGDVPEMYRIVAATGYALGPPALYLATRQIARLPLAGAFAALAFIFLPSPAYLLPALRNDASSFFTDLVLPPNQRLFVLVKYGEGPHVLSLSLALLALAATARYVRSPSAPRLALAVLPLVGAALTNLIGVLGAILFIGFLPASAPLGDTALGRWARVLRVGVLAGLFSLGWYSLGFIRAVFGFTTPGGAEGGSAYVFFPILVGIGVLLVAQLSRHVPEGLELAIGWSVVFAVIVAALQLGGAALVPQPTRFALELDVAFAVAFGVGLAALVRWLAGILEPRAVGALALAFCVAVIVLGAGTWTAVRDDLEPDPHWTEWSERATALWLAAHLAPGERAYLSGDHAFWLDVFADVPQVRGGVDFAFSNPWWAHVAYQMNTGADADVSTLWMEALPVRYVVVAGPGSPEIYKEDWVYPRKFDGRLALALDQRGVRIYEVPRAGDARLVVARVGDLAAPTSAVDRPALETYVNRMRAARAPARLEQRGLGGWRAEVEVADGESVVLRQAYDTGWHATVDGRDVAVRADPIGQLLVPVPAGAHVVELDHRVHGDLLAGIGVATLTALGLLGSGVRGRLRHAAA